MSAPGSVIGSFSTTAGFFSETGGFFSVKMSAP
jgi:hypothetical protein